MGTGTTRPTIGTFARNWSICCGNFQSSATWTQKAQIAIAVATRYLRCRSAQADPSPTLRTVDPLRAIGLDLDLFAAPATDPSHDSSLMVMDS